METNTMPIVRAENVQMIIQSTPATYDQNKSSSTKCAEFGAKLISDICRTGMTDELDQQCAAYIEKAKRTYNTMQERRSPLTKLFDQIRKEFTTMENSIDVTKAGSIPYNIQQYRNEYARKKFEAAEKLRKAEQVKLQQEQSFTRYQSDVTEDYKATFNRVITTAINKLTELNQSITLDNFDEVSQIIKSFNVIVPDDYIEKITSGVRIPGDLSDDLNIVKAKAASKDILKSLFPNFQEQYRFDVGAYRDDIVQTLPSKKTELERIAKANAEEQARMKAELAAKEAAEARRIEDERKRKEEEEKAAQQMKAQAAEMDGLFAQSNIAAAPVGYQPKTSVKKRIVPENAQGIMAIVSLWWAKEGQFLPLEELIKQFKKQITFCEKLANDKDSPEFVTSGFVRYEDEVKAK